MMLEIQRSLLLLLQLFFQFFIQNSGHQNGTEKDFVSPITTKPWGKFIPKLADGEKIKQGELNSQRLYTEPEGLNIDGELPAVPKESFKKGVYY